MTRPTVQRNIKQRRKKLMNFARMMLDRTIYTSAEKELDLRDLNRMIGAALVETAEDAREEIHYSNGYYED